MTFLSVQSCRKNRQRRQRQLIREPGGSGSEFGSGGAVAENSAAGRQSHRIQSARGAVPARRKIRQPRQCQGIRQPRGQPAVPARRPPRGRRAAVVPACRHDNGKLSTHYQTSKIHHIFVRLATKFGVIPSRFLFFMNFGVFNGRKIKINNSRFLKIREKILQLDWIFPNLCAKFQLQIIFFEGFRGGGPAGT